ncbi:MAG: lamin tail domain-containing protein [bacterium]|nr:lamin tail domain-containing protein [bacterium]
MRRAFLYLVIITAFIPHWVGAQTPSCSEKGYTVIFVNGIFGDVDKAKADKDRLQYTLGNSYKDEPLYFQIGYNPTHLAGVADLVQTTAQMFDGTISNYDRDTILLQIHPEVTTRKLILVGHSQGAFYTNEMYFYLLDHGEPTEAVSVYNVGSPAAYTAGANKGSKYLNSSGDALLAFLRTLDFSILPNNVDISTDTSPNGWQGHGFSDTYLAGASERMIEDLHAEMQALVPTYSSEKEDCFTPPDRSIGYNTQLAILGVADPAASAIKFGAHVTIQGSLVLVKSAAFLAQGAVEFFSDSITVTTMPRDEKKDAVKTFEITKKLYGSSLDKEDFKELIGDSQGGAVALALPKEKPIAIGGGFVEGTSTGPVASSSPSILSAPTSSLPFVPAPSTPTQGGSIGTPTKPAPEVITPAPVPPDEATTTEEATSTEESTPPQPPPPPTPPTPPAIVINEVQWAGDAVDSGREWIELKNLSAQSIDLSDLVIVATEGGSQYIPLAGTISPLGFFIIQRDPLAPLNPAANVGFDFSAILRVIPFDQLSDSGEELALVEVGDWGTTTVDTTPPVSACGGWCAGKTVAGSGLNATLSMERIDANASGENASNWASNDTYTASANMPGGNGQALYGTVLLENSQHIAQDFGWFCSPDTYPITLGQTYHPEANTACTYLARFVPWQTNIMSGLFMGTVGSSTSLVIHNSWIGTSAQFVEGVDPVTQPGEQFFAAVWAVRTDTYPQPLDNLTFVTYFTTGHRWARDGFDGPLIDTGDTNPPHDNFRVVPFTYGP